LANDSGENQVFLRPAWIPAFPVPQQLDGAAFDIRRLEFRGKPFVLADDIATGIVEHISDFSVSASGVLVWRTSQPSVGRQLAWFDRSGMQIAGHNALEYYESLAPRQQDQSCPWDWAMLKA